MIFLTLTKLGAKWLFRKQGWTLGKTEVVWWCIVPSKMRPAHLIVVAFDLDILIGVEHFSHFGLDCELGQVVVMSGVAS